jgi:trehalose 6-phosphate phosphatase
VPLPAALEPLRVQPATSAIFVDFDGTLSPIVDDPALARPLDGVPALLAALGARFGVVAVVSGRPAEFLEAHLGRPTGVRLIGLYGLEEVGQPSGPSVDRGELERWRPVMADLADVAEREAPPGVSVERKALAFTLHFRRAPDQAGWVHRFADEHQRLDGLGVQAGRMAIELRPPVSADKGTVVRALVAGCGAACCFGDDLGDLPAFAALSELAREGMAVARVAVVDAESPKAVADAADVIVEGPRGAMDLLADLMAAAGG